MRKNSIQKPIEKLTGRGRIHFTSPGSKIRVTMKIDLNQAGNLLSEMETINFLFPRIRSKQYTAKRIMIQ